MLVISVAVYVLGVLLVIVGKVWLFFNQLFHPLLKAEVELMRRDGKFEGEPDYMQSFRVARSEGELLDNEANSPRARRLFVTGIVLASVGMLVAILSFLVAPLTSEGF